MAGPSLIPPLEPDLANAGINVLLDPPGGDSAHVQLPGLNYNNRRENEAIAKEVLLAEKLTLHVLGPFDGTMS